MASRFEDDEGAWPPGATSQKPKVVQLQQPKQEKKPATPLDWIDLEGRDPPDRKWAIAGWLGYGHTTLLVGQGGIGKTLISQQIGSALALGNHFIDSVERPLKVLMWACEDDHDELWRRQKSIAVHLDAKLSAFRENFILVPRYGMENALVTSDFGKPLFTTLISELEQQAGDLHADVVILDNVAQLYGAGENDRYAVTKFMNALGGALPGKSVLLLAHPSRSQGSEFSGSSAWENVARTRLYLGNKLPDAKIGDDDGVPDTDDVRYLCRRKANYSSKDFRRFTFKCGVLVPDQIEEGNGGSTIDYLRRQRAERVVMDGLAKLKGMNFDPTEGQKSPHYLPRMLMEYKLTEGVSKSELTDAMRSLLMEGRLKKAQIGQYSNRSPKYGLSAQ